MNDFRLPCTASGDVNHILEILGEVIDIGKYRSEVGKQSLALSNLLQP